MSETVAVRRVVSGRDGWLGRVSLSAVVCALLRFAFDATVLPVALLVIASHFGDRAWLFDMTTFFRPHIAAMALVLVALGLLTRSLPRLLGAILLFGAALYPLLVPAAPMATKVAQANFRVMSTNLMGADNHDTEAFRTLVAVEAPDIVVAQEVVPAWRPTLSSLEGYPYTAGPEFQDRESTVMVASRYPIRAAQLFWQAHLEGGPAPGAIPLRIHVARPAPQKPLIVFAIHPPTPRAYRDWKSRNAYLEQVVVQAVREGPDAEVIVVGDWNTPSWSPFFARTVAGAGLRTSEGAWPSPTRVFQEFGAPDLLGTPIDHIAVAPSIGIKALTVGDHFGSDHLPLIADIELP